MKTKTITPVRTYTLNGITYTVLPFVAPREKALTVAARGRRLPGGALRRGGPSA